MRQKAALPDGVTDLPAGKIASVVTFLERFGPPGERPAPQAGLSLRQQRPAEVASYRDLYRRIGQDFLWMSRAVMTDAALADWLNRPTTVVQFAKRGETPVGLVELDRAAAGETEIVSFGVVPEEVGSGLSHFMMAALLADEFAAGARRIWLHTCTLDHPAALRFYAKHGFVPYKIAIEIADDPRLTGHLPRNAAPQVPLLEPH